MVRPWSRYLTGNVDKLFLTCNTAKQYKSGKLPRYAMFKESRIDPILSIILQ